MSSPPVVGDSGNLWRAGLGLRAVTTTRLLRPGQHGGNCVREGAVWAACTGAPVVPTLFHHAAAGHARPYYEIRQPLPVLSLLLPLYAVCRSQRLPWLRVCLTAQPEGQCASFSWGWMLLTTPAVAGCERMSSNHAAGKCHFFFRRGFHMG